MSTVNTAETGKPHCTSSLGMKAYKAGCDDCRDGAHSRPPRPESCRSSAKIRVGWEAALSTQTFGGQCPRLTLEFEADQNCQGSAETSASD